MIAGITGSNGFIGSCFGDELRMRGEYKLRFLTRRSRGGVVADEGVEVVQGDLRSLADCERFVADLDVIYHFAHCNVPLNSDGNRVDDVLSNLVPTLTLVEAIRRQGRRPHLVYMSSGGAVYGASHGRVPFCETDPCQPQTSYGIQKLAAEHYLRIAAAEGALTATVLRVGNAYGVPLPEQRGQGFIGIAVSSLLEGRPIRVFGNSENVRDYIHLKDLFAIARRAAAPRQAFAIYNVGSGRGYSVAEVLAVLEEVHGAPLEVFRDHSKGSHLTDWVVLDCEKARRELNWSATIGLKDGVREILAGARRAMPRVSANA